MTKLNKCKVDGCEQEVHELNTGFCHDHYYDDELCQSCAKDYDKCICKEGFVQG